MISRCKFPNGGKVWILNVSSLLKLVTMRGSGFVPGQRVKFSNYKGVPYRYVFEADDEGRFSGRLEPGRYKVLVLGQPWKLEFKA